MTKEQALELLPQGKRLRRIYWPSGWFFYLDPNGDLRDELGRLTYIYEYGNLEVYVEYFDFSTAIEHVLNGDDVKRRYWCYSIGFNSRGWLVVKDFVEVKYMPSEKDMKARDWILCK